MQKFDELHKVFGLPHKNLFSRLFIPIVIFFLLYGLSQDIYAQTLLLPPMQEDSEPPQHTVLSGETLSEIAEIYDLTTSELMQLNGITNADAIYVGQVLRLPDAVVVPPTATPAPTPELIEYVVGTGETLSEIAQNHGVPMTLVMRLNGIVAPNTVYVGQKLRLPLVSNRVESSSTQPSARSTTKSTDKPVQEPNHTSKEDGNEQKKAPTATNTALPPLSVPKQPQVSNRELSTTLNQIYTVRQGDTLNRIALRLGIKLDALHQVNHLEGTEASRLVVGQELILPATRDELQVRLPTKKYTVKAGDSLGSIAVENGISLDDLLLANDITNPDTISIGRELEIPGTTVQAANGQDASNLQIGPAPSGFHYYTVPSGNTLSEIAAQFDTTIQAILEYNGLPNEATVYAGLELRIPYGPPPLPMRIPPVPISGTRFLVSLSRQECWVFRGDQILYDWQCSTGYDEWTTRTGTFAVKTRLEMAKSTAYELDMPYWLGIYDVGTFENGIHGLPIDWETNEKIWTTLIGQPATFGCAMLVDEEAAILFYLSYLGMPVHIIE